MSIRDEYIKAGIIKPVEKKSESAQALIDELVRVVMRHESAAGCATAKKKKNGKKSKQPIAPPAPSPSKQKRYPAKPLTASDIIKHRSPVIQPPLRCPLCGEAVKSGKMEEHKITKHGESATQPSPQNTPTVLPRAVFVRGGSPGLKS